jgi:hypothetical protein
MAEVTQEQIEAWKKKFGDVFLIEVKDKKLYLRPPGRNELGYMYSTEKKGDNIFDAQAVVMKSCFLGGDSEVIDDDKYFMAACKRLEVLMDFGEAKIKKL